MIVKSPQQRQRFGKYCEYAWICSNVAQQIVIKSAYTQTYMTNVCDIRCTSMEQTRRAYAASKLRWHVH